MVRQMTSQDPGLTRAGALSERPRFSLTPAAFWVCTAALTGALLVLRRPDAVLHAQFWAEDGVAWYADAYNLGAIRALLQARDGYLALLPRLVAAASQWLPLLRAPLLFNLIALMIEALPPLFLVSGRMRNIGPLSLRCGLALLYLLVPESSEVHANITNSQWHLDVLACLVLIAPAPRSRWGRVFDVAVLALCALSTPTGALLLAVALVRTAGPLLFRRWTHVQPSGPETRWSWIQTSVLAACALVQELALLTAGGTRLRTSLGAGVDKFARIVAGQIALPVFLGRNRLYDFSHDSRTITLAAIVITIVTGLVILYALLRGSTELRCFIFLAVLVLLAALTFPNVQPVAYQWDPFLFPGGALRYWYIPKLALMATLVWLLGSQRPVTVRVLAGVLTCVMAFALVTHWAYRPFEDFHFESYAAAFKELPSGAIGQFPLNPAGIWTMKLVKK